MERSIEQGLSDLQARAEAALWRAGTHLGAQMEQHARTHYPWVNRTGAARDSISANCAREPDGVCVQLRGDAPHMRHLEQGRYAILRPTVQKFAARAAAELKLEGENL